VAVPSLDALVESGHDLVAVISRPDAPSGRGRTLHPSPVAARAAELGLEILRPEHPRDPEFQERLRALAPDCCPVVAYGALLPTSALRIPRHGWVNLHFSLLPRWRGAAPVQQSIIAGDATTGATTFRIVKAMDAGPTYRTVTTPITPTTTAGELFDTLAVSGAALLAETMDLVAAGEEPTSQPEEGITLAAKIEVDDARLDWSRPAAELDRLIRGCTPAPGAWTLLRDERFKIGPATPEAGESLPPGTLIVERKSVAVATGDGVLRLGQVQPMGKRPMAAADWARGASLTPGERLG